MTSWQHTGLRAGAGAGVCKGPMGKSHAVTWLLGVGFERELLELAAS